MTNTKWLRRALLGGVALTVMSAGAQADELSDLKAQLEALQARVNTIETRPAALPEGTGLLTYRRGDGVTMLQADKKGEELPTDRGYTISVTPTADLPAPVTEITVYGFAWLDLIYSADDYGGHDSMSLVDFWYGFNSSNDRISLVARRSRFGIKAKTDTAIGQIRVKLEGDFAAGGHFRARHAYGEWDMTPNWTFTAGQTWYIANLLEFGASTIDWAGQAGLTVARDPQIKLTYKGGPFEFGFGISDPTDDTDTSMPNLAGYVKFKAPGGHVFKVVGQVSDYRHFGFNDTAWFVGAGASVNLGDIANFNATVLYGEGDTLLLGQSPGAYSHSINIAGRPAEFVGFTANASFNMTESLTANAGFGYYNYLDYMGFFAMDHTYTVHANIMWRPVQQMKLGWEIAYGKVYAPVGSADTFSGHFGAWFYF